MDHWTEQMAELLKKKCDTSQGDYIWSSGEENLRLVVLGKNVWVSWNKPKKKVYIADKSIIDFMGVHYFCFLIG